MLDKIKKELRLFYSSEEQSGNGKRITYLDMARGIAIFLVVVGHSGLVDHEHNVWLSTFHLPVFFVVSGMLMQLKKEEEASYIKVMLHKIKGIMLPYLWFSLGSLLVDFIQILRGKFPWDMLKEHFIQTITLQGYSVMWFLPVLLISELWMLGILKILARFVRKKLWLGIVATVIAVFFATGAFYAYHGIVSAGGSAFVLDELRILTKSVIASAFVGSGYVVSILFTYKKKKKERAERKGFPGFLAQFGVPGLLLGVAFSAVNLLLRPYIQLMDFNNVNVGNPMLYIGLGLAGSLGLLLICKSIPNIPFITFYGQNTLIIMCTHLNFYIMNAGMKIGNAVFVPLPGPDGLQYMLGSIICTMLLEIPVILMIRMFFPFVLGRGYKMTKPAEKRS